ncbi:C-reactive protein-like isoform X2 [Notolabrus celidotus]|uniref:C-reactive protein-like isoform X2 n=1 Tax=Notolabrus celidotus TaxID=1203425 RepID=UPI00148FE214|nr:C-reactive protein-like isoform X2 [Notolabrus celidotus]
MGVSFVKSQLVMNEMEKLLILVLMLATCGATPQDLSGKVFVFPKETNRDHVKLLTSRVKLNSLTVCMRFKTDLSRNYGLFSLATPSISNNFVLFKPSTGGVMRVHALDGGTDFLSLSFSPNTWHSMCATWRSDNGLAQLWVNGKPTIKRFIKAGVINGAPITILGQEQDSYGGGFDATQSFLGMITKLHMWDYVLSDAEIKRYVDDTQFTPGNIFNWRALDFQVVGDVFVEDQ